MKKVFNLVLALVMLTLVAIPLTSSAVDSIEAPVVPPEIEKIIEDLQVTYRVTVKYIFLDGTPAAPDYSEIMDVGTLYSISSPEIDGYTASTRMVSSTMPGRDVEYTVIYLPNPVKTQETEDAPVQSENKPLPEIFSGSSEYFLTIEDYETARGLGATMMNVGVCAE